MRSTLPHSVGSSPRGRGTHRRPRCRQLGGRFIPAGAGNSTRARRACPTRSVHPRGGGELSWPPIQPPGRTGSSPRGRGTRFCHGNHDVAVRFIPAGAGNSQLAGSVLVRLPVHPRGGGELRGALQPECGVIGSSPRGRGTRDQLNLGRPFARFIPAGAGNSCRWPFPTASGAVHPRGGGELARRASAAVDPAGSSPRGRGTRSGKWLYLMTPRFIPAGAGNSPRPCLPLPRHSVHPRGGGELPTPSRSHSCDTGSSPRGRGTLAWPGRRL